MPSSTTKNFTPEPGLARVDKAETQIAAKPAAQGIAPVDVSRLKEVTDDDPELLLEMVNLYLEESAGFVRKLGMAIQTGAGHELSHLAHTYAGASASCGMTAVVASLRELERMGRTGCLQGAEQVYANVRIELGQIQRFLAESLGMPNE